jgi:DNA polymerase-3 subunit delta'
MKFSDIPGHKDVIEKLLRSVKEERVSHAQLFAGPQGSGKLALALAYAQYVSCENKHENDSCGTCKSCVKYEKMIHPDLHFVFPVVKGKKVTDPVSDNYIEEWREFVKQSPYFTINKWLNSIEVGNAQGMIFASEAAEIIKKLNLKAFESDYKIMIIWLPEKMHTATANKLLKMIEEPPEKTLFILVSEEPDKVISTILSRCQIIKVASVRKEDLIYWLINKYKLSLNKASDIAHVVNGDIVRAADLADNDESISGNLEHFRKLMRHAWKRDVLSIIEWSEEIASTGREAQKNFLSFTLRLIRENFMLTMNQQKNKIVFLAGEESDFSQKFHPFINEKNIFSLTEELNLSHSQIEANGNARIIFLDLALKVIRLIR